MTAVEGSPERSVGGGELQKEERQSGYHKTIRKITNYPENVWFGLMTLP